MCMTGKCAGAQLIIAGILFGLVSFNVFTWLNLPLVFGIIAVIAGIHAFMHSHECCEMPAKKKR